MTAAVTTEAPRVVRASDGFHLLLRAATASDHDTVDAAFGRFLLDTREGYGRFLQAHARLVGEAERRIDPAGLLRDWHPRAPALAADLEALGLAIPQALPLPFLQTVPARWGALYVLEGSRLGGAVLERKVPPDLPRAYLAARHPAGGWRALLAALDAQAAAQDADWQGAALEGAHALFAAFARAAEEPAHG